jgi:hypothetical protein
MEMVGLHPDVVVVVGMIDHSVPPGALTAASLLGE